MNNTGKKIDTLASVILYEGYKLFEKNFPNGTNEEFTFFISCIHGQTGLALYKYEQEKFSKNT